MGAAVVVVVVPPCRVQMAGVAQGLEEVLVLALVPQSAINDFHKFVLHVLGQLGVLPPDQVSPITRGSILDSAQARHCDKPLTFMAQSTAFRRAPGLRSFLPAFTLVSPHLASVRPASS